MTIQLAIVGGLLALVAAALYALVRYARKAERAKVEKEHADAVAEAKDRADKALSRRATRRTVAGRLRDGSF